MINNTFTLKIRKCPFSDREITDILMVSISTVKRWRQGKSHPHWLAMPTIYKALMIK